MWVVAALDPRRGRPSTCREGSARSFIPSLVMLSKPGRNDHGRLPCDNRTARPRLFQGQLLINHPFLRFLMRLTVPGLPVQATTRLLLAAGKHELHRLPGVLCRPDAVLASLPPLIARGVLAAATCSLAHNDLEVTLLTTEPVTYKVCWILGQALKEAVFGLGVGDGLDDDCKLLVEDFNLAEHVCVLGIAQELLQSGVMRIVNGNADVVDCGLRVLMELLVDTDGVGKLDWREGLEMRGYVLLQGWDMACVPLDDLGRVCQYPGATIVADRDTCHLPSSTAHRNGSFASPRPPVGPST